MSVGFTKRSSRFALKFKTILSKTKEPFIDDCIGDDNKEGPLEEPDAQKAIASTMKTVSELKRYEDEDVIMDRFQKLMPESTKREIATRLAKEDQELLKTLELMFKKSLMSETNSESCK